MFEDKIDLRNEKNNNNSTIVLLFEQAIGTRFVIEAQQYNL